MSHINKLTLGIRQPNRRHNIRFNKCAIYGSIIIVILLTLSSNNVLLSSQSSTKPNDCQILTTSTPEHLSTLSTLTLKSCSLIGSLPSTIQHATNLLQLDISDNPGLTSLTASPVEFQSLRKLEILFSSSNTGFKELPPVLGTMTSITRLGWRDGSLTGELDADSIPPNLVHLILTNNNIERLQGKSLFGRLTNVRKLMLSHNQITAFGGNSDDHLDDDGGLSHMINLELLRLAGNNLTFLPQTLWTLPKLTWLTISGNPFTVITTTDATRKAPQIDIKSLTNPYVITNLGQGASGTVRTYIYEGKEVAVKLLHGVTSDGNAEDELAIYSMVGDTGKDHSIVGCIGTLFDSSSSSTTDTGGGQGGGGKEKGVVMERLPLGLEDLALPPTIVEVTQDRWPGDTGGEREKFTPSFVMNTLSDLMEAMVHLHETVGVAHGDVYAHNMKVDRKTGHTFLLDFGASYVVGRYSMEAERLEVRAVGVLIKELSDRLMVGDGNGEDVGVDRRVVLTLKLALKKLVIRCVDANVRKRPSLREIQSSLQQLKQGMDNKLPFLSP